MQRAPRSVSIQLLHHGGYKGNQPAPEHRPACTFWACHYLLPKPPGWLPNKAPTNSLCTPPIQVAGSVGLSITQSPSTTLVLPLPWESVLQLNPPAAGTASWATHTGPHASSVQPLYISSPPSEKKHLKVTVLHAVLISASSNRLSCKEGTGLHSCRADGIHVLQVRWARPLGKTRTKARGKAILSTGTQTGWCNSACGHQGAERTSSPSRAYTPK